MLTATKIMAAMQQYLPEESQQHFDRVITALLQPPVIGEAKWISFTKMPKDNPDRKTEVYQVRAKELGVFLGEIKWYGAFRCYSFFPAPNTVYEPRCLEDITNFIEALMFLRKKEKANG